MTFFVQRILALALAVLVLLPLLTASAQTARTPPVMRLGDAVRPVAYDLALTVDPAQPNYTGRVEIEVDLTRALDFFWINGATLDVRSAVLTLAGQRYEARATSAGEHFIGLDFGRSIPAGRGRLTLAFAGRFSTNETRGLFRQQEQGEWYAFTQFESTHARRAFPCFDEPQWKTPWNVTLTVRREHVAVSNAPMLSERPAEGGMKQVRFATTLPLPTYLVALGVGPFDVVDGGTAGLNKTALRYIVPKGRAAEARYAVQTTGRLLELLENYFGRPYPYEKLDSMVIPITVAFGAMENPGLITYRSGVLLARPGMDDERFQQRYAAIAAHEIAHQWFGDLVTMNWWDDVWLNESFATWMSRKIVWQFNPAWEPFEWREHERRSAFETDRLASTRQVRQPVETRDDLADAFDRITYDKGGAVLSMFEAWLGETPFRDGVRRYLKRHEFGNASAEDFFAALAEADPQIVPGFTSFVQQPGLPVIDFELDCTGRQPAVTVRQQRFLPARAQAPAQRWVMPVCLRYEGGDAPACAMLREREQQIVLPNAAHCPAWLLPNPAGNGYFLSRLDANTARSLASIPLKEPEAIALVTEQAMLVASGAQPVATLLNLARPLARDPRPEVAAAAARAVRELHPALFDAAGRAALAAWVRENFGARAAQLGWLPRAEDSDAVRKLRAEVLPLVTVVGENAALKVQARSLAQSWLAGKRSTIGGMHLALLRTAAHDADAPLVDAYIAAVQEATDSATRIDVYQALGWVRNPALLRRGFEHALSDKVDAREGRELYDAASEDAENAQPLFAFVRERYDALAARLPEESISRMPRWHAHLCSREDAAALQSVYGGARSRLPGTTRNLAQAVETAEICAKARALNAGAVH